MPHMKLTDKVVAKLSAPSDRQLIYWDSTPGWQGFGVLVSGKTGTRSWIVQRGNKRRKIERVELMPLDAAREVARDWLQKLNPRREGGAIDPKVFVAEQQALYLGQRLTLREALADHLETRKGGTLRKPTHNLYNAMASAHLGDWLDKPLHKITGAMALERHKAIREASQKKGGAGQSANAALRMLASVYRSAMKRYPDAFPAGNPIAGAMDGNWLKQGVRDRHVSWNELPALSVALRRLTNPRHRILIELLLFTGCRWKEIAHLRWEEVDLREATISLSAERTKARRAVVIPLSDVPLADLRELKKLGVETSGYCFPGHLRGQPIVDIGTSWKALGDAIGHKLSPHDLRRTYATAAHEAGIDMLLLKRLMNHQTQTDTTLRYIKTSLDKLRAAQQEIADHLRKGMRPRVIRRRQIGTSRNVA